MSLYAEVLRRIAERKRRLTDKRFVMIAPSSEGVIGRHIRKNEKGAQ